MSDTLQYQKQKYYYSFSIYVLATTSHLSNSSRSTVASNSFTRYSHETTERLQSMHRLVDQSYFT